MQSQRKPTSAFETFPWPDPPTDEQREHVSEAARNVAARRQEICNEQRFGLTALYNAVDDGAYADLRAMHGQLDAAVAAAYGWPRAVAQDGDEIVRQLLELNCEIAAGARGYAPFSFGADLVRTYCSSRHDRGAHHCTYASRYPM